MTTNDPVERLLDRLDRVTRSGSSWRARCPAHPDNEPSLSIGRSDNGAALVRCQVGCDTADVLAAVDLQMRDLYPDRNDRARDTWRVGGGTLAAPRGTSAPARPAPTASRAPALGPVVARYTYVDEHGEQLFIKTRHDPKTFRVHRPDGGHGIGDARRVLYRLPELRAAIDAGKTVYLVEGEKDADRLASIGLAATCNFDGAAKAGTRTKWRTEYGDALTGAHVVIIQDRDEAGAAHALAARTDLERKAASVRVVEPATGADHDDVSDHLDAGHTMNDLLPVGQPRTADDAYLDDPALREPPPHDDPALDWADAEERKAAAAELDAVVVRAIAERYQPLDWDQVFAADNLEPDWLIPEVIERGSSHAIFSPSKAGKSLLTLDMVAAIATGRARLGRAAADPVTCLYIDIENSPADLHRRLVDMGYTAADLAKHLIYYSFPNLPPLDTREGGQHLAALAKFHSADLVVLDTLSRVVDGKENDSDTYRALYSHTLSHLKARGITIIRLDHAGKDPTKGQRGSSAKGDDLDTVWFLSPRSENRFTLRLDRQRSGMHPETIQLSRETGPLRHLIIGVGGTEECADPAIAALVAKIDDLGVPSDAGRDRVRKALIPAGISASTSDLAVAIRVRKARREPDAEPDDDTDLWETA